jgi:hypothetical protein
MKRSMYKALGVAVLALGSVQVIGCSDTTGPDAWVGTYTTATKFGGAAGTWNAYHDLVVMSETDIRLNNVAIVNPTWVGDALSWTTADGNSGNANITFKTSSSNTYYWTSPVEGLLFEGTYQNPGEGAIDFRGIVE